MFEQFFKLPTLKENLENKINNEIKWYWQDRKIKEIYFSYGISGVPVRYQIHSLTAGIEMSLMYTREIQKELEIEKKKNKELENRLLILEELVATQIKKE
jgi:hypothetical protein